MGLNEPPKTGLYEHCSYNRELDCILYYICIYAPTLLTMTLNMHSNVSTIYNGCPYV